MYDIFSKYKEDKKEKNSKNFSSKFPNLRLKNIDSSIGKSNKAILGKVEVNSQRNIHTCNGFRPIYIEDKVKLIKNENNIFNQYVNIISSNIVNGNPRISNFKDILNAENGPKISNPNNTNTKETHNNSSHKNAITRNNISKEEDIIKFLYDEDKTEIILKEKKKEITKKKELRSKIYKLLRSKEAIPICCDFIHKVEDFNMKLKSALKSESNLKKEKKISEKWHFSNNIEEHFVNLIFMNTKDIKKEVLPLEKLLKKHFTKEDLNIIKNDLDFFNKHTKMLDTIKFLKQQSLLNRVNEEDEKEELRKRREELKKMKFKDLGAYKILKRFLTFHLIRPLLEQKSIKINPDKPEKDEIDKIKEEKKRLLSEFSEENEEKDKKNKEKIIENMLTKMSSNLNKNKRESFICKDKFLNLNKGRKLDHLWSGKSRPTASNLLSTDAFTKNNVN